MLPLARVVSAGHGIHPVFARALPAALNFDPARPAESRQHWLRSLTFRERQCLSLEMGVSEETVELHLARAHHRLGARTTAQAIAINLAMAMIDR